MVGEPPPPDPHTLIPPLLAFLPTSFASTQCPPALLPLLSPILQQRLQIHTSGASAAHDSWLRLLCWNTTKAEKLKENVENGNYEPHPVSGEIEVGELGTIKYKRFDQETLKAQIPLPDWDLTAMYLWCMGKDNTAWKLAELLPYDIDLEQDQGWSASIQEANNTAAPGTSLKVAPAAERKMSVPGEDEDYWAMYDQTPGRTPARQGSVNPTGAGVSEEDYYARYGDVQPAMDNYDPDEAPQADEAPSLNKHALQEMLDKGRNKPLDSEQFSQLKQVETTRLTPPNENYVQPVPSSPSSRAGSDTVAKLEGKAERFAAEVGIRQHISASVKSMYRLAKSAGICRDDFEQMVQRELETLSIFDRDD